MSPLNHKTHIATPIFCANLISPKNYNTKTLAHTFKLRKTLSCQEAACEMLVKLTPVCTFF